MRKPFAGGVLLAVAVLWSAAASAGDYTITIKNHEFLPVNLVVPAGQRVMLTVINEDPTPSEFESTDLGREKVVTPGGSITVYVGPLDPGSYGFFDDFHRETTGTIVVK